MRDRMLHDAAAMALLLGAVLVAVALLSHSPLDPSPLHLSSLRDHPENLAGWLGATLSAALLSFIGLTALVLPPLAAVAGWRLLRQRSLVNPRQTTVGWGLILLAAPGFADMVRSEVVLRGGAVPCGGLLGLAENQLLGSFAGPVGRVVLLTFILVVGVLMVSGVTGATVVDRLGGRLRHWLRQRRTERTRRRRERDREKDRRRVLQRQMNRLENEDEYRGTVSVKEMRGRGRFRIVRKVAGALSPDVAEVDAAAGTPARRRRSGTGAKDQAAAKRAVVQEEFDFVDELNGYDLPKTSFLERPDQLAVRDSNALIEISKVLTDKCREFRVSGEVVNIRTGPVITTYELRLDSGVKISAVQNLAEDLALALRSESVRVDRIPGRATVGIEVPNPEPEVIRLRDLIESPEFQRAASLLTLCLGVDIHGNPFFSDLGRMPHLLIGGFTGAGKSVGINAMVMSILYRARPEQLKFILVDPKMVELGVYADIPHLLTPIITNPKKAANALGWAVAEMDNRYRLLAALGVRNLGQYNQVVSDPVQLRKAQQIVGERDEQIASLEPLPYVVIIIDELADLMLASSRAVEESITRLAQKARAVGIHLICATQRPSVDILTGIIKANFPCRIAYKVRSKFDSRTILDAIGAEHLLGRGDMLYLPPGTSSVMRLHGPLVTEKEIATVVRYVKRFGKPEYKRDVLSHAPLGDNGRGGRRTAVDDEDELTDPMYAKAARVVVTTRKASASYIQRRLHLGYTRSARLLDMMEREGVVGPLNGSKGREVLVPPDFFEEVDDTHALNPADDEGD